jgi:hypothetical protein
VFANPKLAVDREYRRAVVGYLKYASVSPLALRRLAEPDADRASQVFRQVLRRPGFSWKRDGEALLRRYKASWFERAALTGVVPVGRPWPTPTRPRRRWRRRATREAKPMRMMSGTLHLVVLVGRTRNQTGTTRRPVDGHLLALPLGSERCSRGRELRKSSASKAWPAVRVPVCWTSRLRTRSVASTTRGALMA